MEAAMYVWMKRKWYIKGKRAKAKPVAATQNYPQTDVMYVNVHKKLQLQ